MNAARFLRNLLGGQKKTKGDKKCSLCPQPAFFNVTPALPPPGDYCRECYDEEMERIRK